MSEQERVAAVVERMLADYDTVMNVKAEAQDIAAAVVRDRADRDQGLRAAVRARSDEFDKGYGRPASAAEGNIFRTLLDSEPVGSVPQPSDAEAAVERTSRDECPAHSEEFMYVAVRGNRRNLGYEPQPCTCEVVVEPDYEAAFHKALGTSERLRAVHARYFDLDGKPGFDDTTPEPEDVWRYDRDFRAALDSPTPDQQDDGGPGDRARVMGEALSKRCICRLSTARLVVCPVHPDQQGDAAERDGSAS